MSNEEVPESLADYQNVIENDGVLTTENITPAEFLTGESFLSNSWLPDVKPNTKIVGICGISDWNEENDPNLPGNAAPNRLGWHFADFYLFHHLLKEVASDQVWLTCVSPKSAVEKYGRYVYGDFSPKKTEKRRVVLDKNMLGELNDVQTVSPEDLLENTLANISKTCVEATAEGRPVLILIFSGASQPGYSIEMGGENAEDPKYLTRESFRQAIGSQAPEAGLCLLATEYHTGAWAINPDMKVAPVASRGAYYESLAWPISGTINMRPCGPEFAYQVTDMLLRLNLEGFVARENDGNRGVDYEEYDEKLHSMVEDFLRKEESKDKSLFSGDDEWKTEYSERVGIHVSEFYQRWCLLKDATPGYDELVAAVKNEVEVYRNKLPGSDNEITNRKLHTKLHDFMRGTVSPSFLELELLRREIDYRLDIIKTATEYKNLWDLSVENCEDTKVMAYTDFSNYGWQLVTLVGSYELFDHRNFQDDKYVKGEWYLASIMISQGWDRAQAVEKLKKLVHYRASKAPIGNSIGPVEPVVCSSPPQAPGFSNDQEFSVVTKEAKQYLNSKLRIHETAKDTSLHGSIRQIFRGTRSDYGYGYVRSGVDHRINHIMGTATLYKDFLDIDYPSCHEMDVNEFRCVNDIGRRFDIEDLLATYPLFNLTNHHGYYKGREYLAQCISRQSWSKSERETRARLDNLVKYADLRLPGSGVLKVPNSGVPGLKGASQILETINQFRLSRDDRIRTIIWKFAEITGCKIRSLP
ncbi:hypothetical protein V493_07995 [Pseudogymnoascus sp. VKM F-4281 (FW-2241)]|nr:hypothetical protein V493_07995 [Pseudogymnoascus sp. VKM F-4281 (FW-2241)]